MAVKTFAVKVRYTSVFKRAELYLSVDWRGSEVFRSVFKRVLVRNLLSVLFRYAGGRAAEEAWLQSPPDAEPWGPDFAALDPEDGRVSPAAAKERLLQSGLPSSVRPPLPEPPGKEGRRRVRQTISGAEPALPTCLLPFSYVVITMDFSERKTHGLNSRCCTRSGTSPACPRPSKAAVSTCTSPRARRRGAIAPFVLPNACCYRHNLEFGPEISSTKKQELFVISRRDFIHLLMLSTWNFRIGYSVFRFVKWIRYTLCQHFIAMHKAELMLPTALPPGWDVQHWI